MSTVYEYFVPKSFTVEITDFDRKKLTQWESNGKYRDEASQYPVPNTGFHALVWGKKRANLCVSMWRECLKEGTSLRHELLEFPDHVRVFIEKSL
jgi:hypothetical protein